MYVERVCVLRGVCVCVLGGCMCMEKECICWEDVNIARVIKLRGEGGCSTVGTVVQTVYSPWLRRWST